MNKTGKCAQMTVEPSNIRYPTRSCVFLAVVYTLMNRYVVSFLRLNRPFGLYDEKIMKPFCGLFLLFIIKGRLELIDVCSDCTFGEILSLS